MPPIVTLKPDIMTKHTLELAAPKYWPSWFALGTVWVITRLPFRWQTVIGKSLGKLLYYFPTKIKHITETNIKLCFPEYTDEQRTALVKKNFTELGAGLIDSLGALWMSDEKLRPLFKMHGLENAKAAFDKGKGVLFVGPHFLGIEVMGRILGLSFPLVGMYRPHKKRFVAFIQSQLRKSNSTHYIARQQIRELLRSLERNMAIGYAYDIDGGTDRSVFAPFFGIQTATLTAVMRIVTKSGASIVPVKFYRDEKTFSYDIYFSPPLENFPTEDYVSDATRLNALMEEAIRIKPEQYMWQYKRFKTRPAGEKRFY